MTEQDLDLLLAQEATLLPPTDDIVQETNPWETPIWRIVAGLALITLKLGFFHLDDILPTVGYLQLYLGFRALRKENRWFTAAWLLSAFWFLARPVNLAAAALGIATSIQFTAASVPLWALLWTLLVQGGFFLLFRQGLKEVFRKAGVERQDGDPLLWAFIWVAALALLALTPLAQNWIIVFILIGAYILILRALCRVPDQLAGSPEALSDAGYALSAAPVRVTDQVVRRFYLWGCLALVLGCCLVANHTFLDPQPAVQPGAVEIRQELEDLGFPAQLLADLPDETVEGLTGALTVKSHQELLMYDPQDVPVVNSYGLETQQYVQEPGLYNLDVTAVLVELPGYQCRIFAFFQWRDDLAQGKDHAPFWTDGFSLTSNEYANITGCDGALLYEKEGQRYTAPVPELRYAVHTYETLFGSNTRKLVTGKVCYPLGAKNRRGWVLAELDETALFTDSSGTTKEAAYYWGGYTHFAYRRVSSPLQFPYQDPVDVFYPSVFSLDFSSHGPVTRSFSTFYDDWE